MKKQWSQLGSNIRAIREEQGISIAQFAEKISVGERMICNYENGQPNIDYPRLKAICKVLGKSIEEIENWHEKKGLNADSQQEGGPSEDAGTTLEQIERLLNILKKKMK